MSWNSPFGFSLYVSVQVYFPVDFVPTSFHVPFDAVNAGMCGLVGIDDRFY